MICPKCGAKAEESLAFVWSASCPECGWFSGDYKPGPSKVDRANQQVADRLFGPSEI